MQPNQNESSTEPITKIITSKNNQPVDQTKQANKQTIKLKQTRIKNKIKTQRIKTDDGDMYK